MLKKLLLAHVSKLRGCFTVVTRLPVGILIEKIAYGATIENLKKDYPFLKDDDIRAALLYAAKRLALEETYAA